MEDNNKISSIIGGLDADSMHQLESQKADFNKKFQSGDNANNFSATVNTINDALSGKLIALLISNVESKVSEHLVEASSKMAAPPDILGMAAKLIPDFLMNQSEIMDLLTVNQDDKLEEDIEKDQEKTIEDINNNFKEKSAQLTDKIKEKINADKIKGKVESILKFSAQGAQWVDVQLTALANMLIKSANEEIDNTFSAIEKTKQDLAESLSKSIAKKEANKQNKVLQKELKKVKDQKDRAEKKGKLVSAAAAKKAVFKVLALMGG